jgi:hypothetical protein
MKDIVKHPFVIQGFCKEDLDLWINADRDIIHVTDEEIKNAISFPGFLKRGIKLIKSKFFKSAKRATSMPVISKFMILLIKVDSSLRNDLHLNSRPSVPVMMPYLPEAVESRANDIKKIKNVGSGLILDNQSEVSDLMPDQPWITWEDYDNIDSQ